MPVTKLTPGTPGNGMQFGSASMMRSRPKPRSPSASTNSPKVTLSSGRPRVRRCKTCEVVSRSECSEIVPVDRSKGKILFRDVL